MPQTILVVDDKSSVRILLEEYLQENGFVVATATNGEEAIYEARHTQPDLILLDIMMPKMDGYQFLQRYRKENQTPVIIITAREEETDAVLGLELGADDYIIKPFRMRELVARIHAVLRRGQAESQDGLKRIKVGDVILDAANYEVNVRGESVNLTPTEFNLLTIFMESAGQVIPRDILYDRLIDNGFNGLEKTVNVHIRNLRTKIEANPSDPIYIETIFGVGYRFNKPD